MIGVNDAVEGSLGKQEKSGELCKKLERVASSSQLGFSRLIVGSGVLPGLPVFLVCGPAPRIGHHIRRG